jgi:mannose-6-phosphate isomerase-like protein (cupin superfamily)
VTATRSFTLDSSYVNLRPDDSATVLKIGPRFWANVHMRTDLNDGRLVGATRQTKDWPFWERHPAGEEILILLSGELRMVLQTRRGMQRVPLKAGQTLMVPRGLWHRAVVKKPGVLIFITPGGGTEHRPFRAAKS